MALDLLQAWLPRKLTSTRPDGVPGSLQDGPWGQHPQEAHLSVRSREPHAASSSALSCSLLSPLTHGRAEPSSATHVLRDV